MFLVVAFSDEVGTNWWILVVACCLCYFGHSRLGLRCTEGNGFVLGSLTPWEKILLALAQCTGGKGREPSGVALLLHPKPEAASKEKPPSEVVTQIPVTA